jgi:hypothetical protein
MYGTTCEQTSDSTRWNGVSGSDSGFAALNPCPCEYDLECAAPSVGFSAQAETPLQAERAVNPNDRHITQQEGITTVRLPSKKCLGDDASRLLRSSNGAPRFPFCLRH